MFLPTSRGFTSSRDHFNDLVITQIKDLATHCDRLRDIEFCVEDVPPSSPAPWENHGVVLARLFPADKVAKLTMRLVLYRWAIIGRCHNDRDIAQLVRQVIVENASNGLNIPPEDIDPTY